MPDWRIVFTKSAEQDLGKLDVSIRRRVIAKLSWLGKNFENVLPKALSAELAHFYKLRIGDWRVIYSVHKKDYEILIMAIDHRTKIYD